MDERFDKLIDLVNNFYNTSYDESILYHEVQIGHFLDFAQFISSVDNAYELLKSDNLKFNISDFICGLEHPDCQILTYCIDALFPRIKKYYDDEVKPDSQHVLALNAICEAYYMRKDFLLTHSPTYAYKFEIMHMICMGLRKPILQYCDLGSRLELQSSYLLTLIELNPELISKRNELERVSGINRATIAKIKRKWEKDRTLEKRKKYPNPFNQTPEERISFNKWNLAQLEKLLEFDKKYEG